MVHRSFVMQIQPYITANVPNTYFLFFRVHETRLINTSTMAERSQIVGNSAQEDEAHQNRNSISLEARFKVLSSNVERISDQLALLNEALVMEPADHDFDEERPAETSSVFDPAESLSGAVSGKSLDEVDLPYNELFKDSEDCGPKVLDGIPKRINSSCTKKPAKEQFQTIQKKYLRALNCEFLKTPRVNPELWDDLRDRTKTRKFPFRRFKRI